MPGYAIGDRLADLRKRNGMTQEALAEAAGLHVNVISKIERGGTASMRTYHAIARTLGVVTMVFVPPATTAPEPAEAQDGRDVALADLRAAVSPPRTVRGPVRDDDVDQGPPDLQRLGRGIRYLVESYHRNRFDDVAQLAPGLIRSATYHVEAVAEQQRREAHRLRGDVLGLTGRYLVQVRSHDLALTALHRGLDDAAAAGDQLLAAAIMTNQAWAMLRQARFAEVEQLCATAADEIEPRVSEATPDELSAWGWLLLRASTAAARNNRVSEAREFLSVAQAAATRLGTEHSDPVGHNGFGPMTAYLIGPENEMTAGEPGRALELVGQLPQGVGRANPSSWQRHLLDRARALVDTGRPDRAMEIITGIQRTAPGWLRHQRYGREIAQDIIEGRSRPLTDEQRGLADFLRLN